ncbi:MAG TPA: phosphopantetheine-binding protein [Micromonosporaceae bacterium]|jgi:acyl carrier protein|nr:phosphopantetheine-binding protein [Micromonosporaceae bacterium]
MTALRTQLANLLAEASDGDVSAEELLISEQSLAALGIGSLAYLRLIDAAESRFGVRLDLDDDLSFLDSLDSLTKHLAALGVPESTEEPVAESG